MASDSKREGLAIIIGKLKSQAKQNPYGQHAKLGSLLNKSSEDEHQHGDDTDQHDHSGQVEAAQDCLLAIDAKDAVAFLEALKDLMVLCAEDECDEDANADQDIEQVEDHSSLFDEPDSGE